MNQARVPRNESLVRSSMLLIVRFMIKLVPYRFLHRAVNYMLASEIIFGASFRLKLVFIVGRTLHKASPSAVIFCSDVLI